MSKITMKFELDETWKPDDGSHENRYPGVALFWTSPSLKKPCMAAHVYGNMGQWEWYAFPPCATQASAGWVQDRKATEVEAKHAALHALRLMARGVQ